MKNSIKESLAWAEAQLLQSEIEESYSKSDAVVDASYLLSFILQKNLTWLKTWPESELNLEQLEEFKSLIMRRQSGEPVAYITGEKAFWTLLLETEPSTLIPRPETELLVERALAYLNNKSQATILDLGTGTGAIALAIAAERSSDFVYGCDYSSHAVALAKRNSERNGIKNVNFFQSNWYSNLENFVAKSTRHSSSFDLIVSNPPYVAAGDPHLSRGDLRYEPTSALVAEGNGLDDIRHIAKHAGNYLKKGGALMVEHGYDQAQAVARIFADANFEQIETVKDYGNQDRVTCGVLQSCDI
ncbi:peptide chain release factor N(5)-glutamine methyltransferase [Aliikangiella sp. G2MR2-5]|uniref:peptide chain release factor N(5)-glutamine methyltransferase n=1 Tax=Aliikangiella sp. G2MR2-5 TaxID=2788943 RepID=UPI0018AC15A5|nr:peptide chain release factor N(5)-glutamine methyltransferase [Aliikangiella sp. G2MR2-5]